jgi:Uma2 family endonuclease
VIEVLSQSTRAIDLDEKLTAYLSIESLHVYVLLEQDKPYAIAMRRTSAGFLREVYEGLSAVVALPTVGCTLSLDEVYSGVEFTPTTVQEPTATY